MLKKEFVIDEVFYVVYFDGINLSLYVDTIKSTRNVVKLSRIENAFGDVPPDKYYKKLSKPSVVFKVIKEVKDFVDDVIKKERPYYFVFSANEVDKISSYSKLANKLAKKYEYSVFLDDNIFRFYKSP